MADRRMFSRSVVSTDAFLDMPGAVQALYFHISLEADDDGFCASPNKIVRMLGLSENDLQQLVDRGWIIRFPSGVVAVIHWRLSNTIQSDRYTPTVWQAEKSMLEGGGKGEAYRLPKGSSILCVQAIDSRMEPDRKQIVSKMEHSKVIREEKEEEEKKVICATEKRNSENKKSNRTRDAPGFEAFYAAYPKHRAKADAQKAWNTLNPSDELQKQILSAINIQRESPDWKKDGGKYIPLPASWLRGRRWEDETNIPSASKFSNHDLGVTL